MRKILSVILLGASWAVLAGCEQQDTLPEPAEGLPQNETPRAEPDVQIGSRDEPVEPGEPATPSPAPAPIEEQPGGAGADVGGPDEQPPGN